MNDLVERSESGLGVRRKLRGRLRRRCRIWKRRFWKVIRDLILLDFIEYSTEDTTCGGGSSVAENHSPWRNYDRWEIYHRKRKLLLKLCRSSSDEPRQLSVYLYGHFSMTNASFRTQIRLFLRGGLSRNEGRRLVSRKRSFHFSMAEERVLEDRKRCVRWG